MSFLHRVDLFSRQEKAAGPPAPSIPGAGGCTQKGAQCYRTALLSASWTSNPEKHANCSSHCRLRHSGMAAVSLLFFIKQRITPWNLSCPQRFLSVFSLQGQAGRCLCSLPTFPGSKASGSFRRRCWRFKRWQAGTDEHTCHTSPLESAGYRFL